MTTTTAAQYPLLEPRPGSNYRQLFLKGRRIRAAVVYEAVHGPDPHTPEEFAEDYQVALEAVHEALDYVARNLPLIEQERAREAADVRARGLDRPPRPASGPSPPP
jgi:uncharacterized protein (DUF433 family)